MLKLDDLKFKENSIEKANYFYGENNSQEIATRNKILFPDENILPLDMENAKKEQALKALNNEIAVESTDTAATEPANSQPSGAYNISFDILYSDSISGKGVRRWYYFELTEQKKITLYMSPVADTSVDNDLVLYQLDTATGNLTEIARSQNGAACYELLSYVADAGYYFFCVAAYAGDSANSFSFLARLSDKWDSLEGDDSLAQAPIQPINQPVKHTIDNAIDQDLSILQVSENGQYSINLYGVPDNCNYQLQIFDASMNQLATVANNSPLKVSIEAGAYVLKLLSTDGSFDADAEVSVLVSSVPSTVNINNPNNYFATTTSDGKHYVEFMSIAGFSQSGAIIGVSVDGTAIDVRSINLKITRTNYTLNGSECSCSTSNDTRIVTTAFGRYTGSKQKGAIALKNPLLLAISPAIYGEYHYQKHSDGTTTSWNSAMNLLMYIIFDMDTMKFVDIYKPNWYAGESSICGYPLYGSPEFIYFEPSLSKGSYLPND